MTSIQKDPHTLAYSQWSTVFTRRRHLNSVAKSVHEWGVTFSLKVHVFGGRSAGGLLLKAQNIYCGLDCLLSCLWWKCQKACQGTISSITDSLQAASLRTFHTCGLCQETFFHIILMPKHSVVLSWSTTGLLGAQFLVFWGFFTWLNTINFKVIRADAR